MIIKTNKNIKQKYAHIHEKFTNSIEWKGNMKASYQNAHQSMKQETRGRLYEAPEF